MWSVVAHGILAAGSRAAMPLEYGGPADCCKNIFLASSGAPV